MGLARGYAALVRNIEWVRGDSGMKFFKHFCDAHRGQSLRIVRKELGMAGIGMYWTLVELCAEKLEKRAEEEYTPEHCHFSFERSYLSSHLGVKPARLEVILKSFQRSNQLQLESLEHIIKIHMPKLLECLDRDSKRARTERAMPAPKRKSKRKKEDKEKEEEKEICGAADLVSILPEEIHNLYDNEGYVTRESVKAWVWLKNNPERVPKSLKGFRRFFCGWLERGWESHRKSIPSNPVKGSGNDWEMTATRVLNSLIKHGTGSKASAEIEQDLGPELYRIVLKAGTQKIRDVNRGPYQLKTISEMLSRASEILKGASDAKVS